MTKTPMEKSDEKFNDFKNGKATKDEVVSAIDESIEYLENKIRENSK